MNGSRPRRRPRLLAGLLMVLAGLTGQLGTVARLPQPAWQAPAIGRIVQLCGRHRHPGRHAVPHGDLVYADGCEGAALLTPLVPASAQPDGPSSRRAARIVQPPQVPGLVVQLRHAQPRGPPVRA